MRAALPAVGAFLTAALAAGVAPAQTPSTYYAGMRVSTIPFSPFPASDFFVTNSRCMTTKVIGSQPVLVWIVSLYWSQGSIGIDFPKPAGAPSYPFINFKSTDRSEPYLTAFDQQGIKVWLQVEPGDANMLDLIDLVLSRYQHHPCVVGVGVDVEWFNPTQVSNGRAVTDAEAQAWNTRIKSFNPSYRLFLKHYLQSKMPPTVRGDLLFVDDSQGFSSLTSMVNEFKSWGNKFKPAEVGFQYGYPDDRPWWSTYADPSGTIASALRTNVTNASTFLWVDFTIQEILPLGTAPTFQSQPQPVAVRLGKTATFTAPAGGAGTLTWQWRRGGVALPSDPRYAGATSATLTITNVKTTDVGSYQCVARNGCGETITATAALTLRVPGDLNHDALVSSADYALFEACLLGPHVPPSGPTCIEADLDDDVDVDLADFGVFQRCFRGPSAAGDPACAG